MAYTRWGMTEAEAEALTGTGTGDGATLTEQILDRAETDLVDVLGWRPDPAGWSVGGTVTDERARAFGRAVAWQAAWRSAGGGAAPDPSAPGNVESEGWPDYNVGYGEGGKQTRAELPASPRALELLARFGWYARGSVSSTGASRGRDPFAWGIG